jgi:hypothetical protein
MYWGVEWSKAINCSKKSLYQLNKLKTICLQCGKYEKRERTISTHIDGNTNYEKGLILSSTSM